MPVSIPAAHIPRARGSEGLWQQSWTQAVCFTHLLSEVHIKRTKPKIRALDGGESEKVEEEFALRLLLWSPE